VDKDTGFGSLVLVTNGSLASITIQGRVERGWMEGLLDAAVSDERAAFDASWKDPTEFSAWEADVGDPSADLGWKDLFDRLDCTVRVAPERADAFAELETQIGKSRRYAAQVFSRVVEDTQDSEWPELRSYIGVLCAMTLERPALALDFVDGLDISAERTFERAMLRAWLTREAGRLEEALAEFRELARERPKESLVHAEIAELLLLLARPAEAHEAILAGRAAVPASTALADLEVRVVKALQGPPWEKTMEQVGEHFLVRSDGDRKLARDAARVLDEAWTRCEEFFGTLAAPPSEPSLAYVFSGEASYLAYVQGTAGAAIENSRGIYSEYLKQIAAWNEPSAAILWDTLRHECAHRFLELRYGWRIPRWLNEGLAEVFAACWARDDRWLPGGMRTERLDWYASGRLKAGEKHLRPLEAFLFLDDETFLADAERCYAQAWSFVHFLRFGDETKREMLGTILSELARGEDPAAATDRAFEGTDLSELGVSYQDWLRARLREEKER
jgi:hypothetical protein